MAGLWLPEVEEAVTAGQLLADLRALWRRATLDERHELLKGMVAKVYVDLVSRRIVGVTPKPAFWSRFEQVRVEHPRMLLRAPDEGKRRLAEPQAAALVETGEDQSLPSPPETPLYSLPAFLVIPTPERV